MDDTNGVVDNSGVMNRMTDIDTSQQQQQVVKPEASKMESIQNSVALPMASVVATSASSVLVGNTVGSVGSGGVGGGAAVGGVVVGSSNNSGGGGSSSTHPSCGPAPPIEIKLFVGRVPRSYTEEMIRPIFEEYGTVSEVVIIRDKQTGNHKGSAFVRMGSIAHADFAIRSLNNQKSLDSTLGPLQVKYATGEAESLGIAATSGGEPGLDQAKLFVGSLPKTVSEELIRETFGRYGTIDEIYIMKDSTSNHGKGCAFVKYSYKEQALYAVNALNGKFTMSGGPRPMEVRFAENRRQQQQQQAAGGGFIGVGGGGGGAFGSPTGGGFGGGGMGGGGGPRGGGGGGMGGVGGRPASMPPSNAAPRQAGLWKEYFTQDSRAYYHNEQTGQTQWDRPIEFEQLGGGGGGGGGGAMGMMSSEATGPAGANIFIFHIPNEWTQHDLLSNFGQFGSVLSARIAQDRSTGRNRGFAFVSYDNKDAATNAVTSMNGFMACGKRLKVTIKKGEEIHPGNNMVGMTTQAQQQQVGGGTSQMQNAVAMGGGAASGGQGGGGYGASNVGIQGGGGYGSAQPTSYGASPVQGGGGYGATAGQIQGGGGYGGYGSFGGGQHRYTPY